MLNKDHKITKTILQFVQTKEVEDRREKVKNEGCFQHRALWESPREEIIIF